MHNSTDSSGSFINRRQMLRGAAGATAIGALALAGHAKAVEDNKKKHGSEKLKGQINHSIVHWCFAEHWNVEQTCQVANKLGCASVELVAPEHWETLKKHNLTCAIAGSHLFVQGMNNPKYQDACIAMMKKSIDASAEAGIKTVITFTGYAAETGDWADGGVPDLKVFPSKDARVIAPDEGVKNCIAGYKRIVGHAEKKKVNLSLEMLNTRENSHPMKGHPGYQGDHIDYCMEIINGVGSPSLGLLFDIYHVQIMDGDIIRRIKQCKESINHVHTAGNPGRKELDATQEINYTPCMQALVDIGYKGYVGHEFIPTRDPEEGLTEAVAVCDV